MTDKQIINILSEGFPIAGVLMSRGGWLNAAIEIRMSQRFEADADQGYGIVWRIDLLGAMDEAYHSVYHFRYYHRHFMRRTPSMPLSKNNAARLRNHPPPDRALTSSTKSKACSTQQSCFRTKPGSPIIKACQTPTAIDKAVGKPTSNHRCRWHCSEAQQTAIEDDPSARRRTRAGRPRRGHAREWPQQPDSEVALAFARWCGPPRCCSARTPDIVHRAARKTSTPCWSCARPCGRTRNELHQHHHP
jgi:hypothetical protein